MHAEGIQSVLAPSRGPGRGPRELAERLGRRIDPDPVILTVNVRCACEEPGSSLTRPARGSSRPVTSRPGCFSGPPVPREKPADTAKPAAEHWLEPAGDARRLPAGHGESRLGRTSRNP
ncbi:MAG: hypothetical protein MZV70_18880 [Desulfobacterales bacterium]|nr:hypothetical protein [Desulfobacterales bacterium]